MNATKTSNRVRLLRNTTSAPEDRRTGASAGGPMVVGDVATLSFYTEHGRGPGWKFEYVKVRVVGRVGLNYRGVVLDRIIPDLISPEKLSKGMELTFDGWNVIQMEDADDTHGGQPGAF